jgi:hypothetical protein
MLWLLAAVRPQSQNILINGFDTDEPDDRSVAKLADFGGQNGTMKAWGGQTKNGLKLKPSELSTLFLSHLMASRLLPNFSRKGQESAIPRAVCKSEPAAPYIHSARNSPLVPPTYLA